MSLIRGQWVPMMPFGPYVPITAYKLSFLNHATADERSDFPKSACEDILLPSVYGKTYEHTKFQQNHYFSDIIYIKLLIKK